METLGLVFTERGSGKRFAYYTDCKTVPPAARELARGSDLLVLDGLRPTPHPTHLSIPEALVEAEHIGAKRTYLTHLTHAVTQRQEAELAPGIDGFAYDGMRVVL